jgi:hypothetical protein
MQTQPYPLASCNIPTYPYDSYPTPRDVYPHHTADASPDTPLPSQHVQKQLPAPSTITSTPVQIFNPGQVIPLSILFFSGSVRKRDRRQYRQGEEGATQQGGPIIFFPVKYLLFMNCLVRKNVTINLYKYSMKEFGTAVVKIKISVQHENTL